MSKKQPSKFDEVISFAIPNFLDFNFDVEEFCGYYIETGKTCPFIEMDADRTREHKNLFNFEPTNCFWLCKWFVRQDLPSKAVKADRKKLT